MQDVSATHLISFREEIKICSIIHEQILEYEFPTESWVTLLCHAVTNHDWLSGRPKTWIRGWFVS